MLDEKFVIIAAVIAFFGGLSYLVDTLRGKNQPHRVTWFLWALAPLIAFAAQIKEGVGLIALMTFMVGFMPLLIFLASFVNKKAVWKATSFDYICGVFSLLGLILWLQTGEGNLAIIFSLVADAFAAIPTLLKSYSHPETESWFGYFLFAIAAAITILTIHEWSFAAYGFPVYVLILDTTLISLIGFKVGLRFSR